MRLDKRINAKQPHKYNRKAAWSLTLLAPFIAELAFGSTPPHLAYLIIVWLPIYGAGVVLIRELARRWGCGWSGIILLGICYELLEDGFGLQALTSPQLYHAAEWGPRIAGINTTYWEANLFYHVLFSILIPICLVELLFKTHGTRPYLSKAGLWVVGVTAFAGVGLLRVSVPPSQDPGYQAPLLFLAGLALIIITLVVFTYRRRTKALVVTATTAPPAPRVLAVVAAISSFVILLPFIGYGGNQAFGLGRYPGALIPMVLALGAAVVTLNYIRKSITSKQWRSAHSVALLAGALASHFVFGLVFIAHSIIDRLGLVLINGLLALIVARAARRAAV